MCPVKRTTLPLVCAATALGCASLGGLSFNLVPQPRPAPDCSASPAFAKLRPDAVAVAGFNPSTDRHREDIRTAPYAPNAVPLYHYLDGDGAAASRAAENALTEGFRFKVVERRDLDKLIEEQRLQATGLIDAREAVRLGKMAGADAVLFGDVERAASQLECKASPQSFVGVYTASAALKLRLVGVETGETLWACSIRRNSLQYLDAPIEVSNAILRRDVHFWDAPLRGASPQDRIQSVIDSAVREALATLR